MEEVEEASSKDPVIDGVMEPNGIDCGRPGDERKYCDGDDGFFFFVFPQGQRSTSLK